MKTYVFKLFITPTLLILLFISSCKQKQATINKNEAELKKDVNVFVDQWHKNAAEADLEYFNKIADGGIYIGTDKTEHWTKAEFQAWSKKFFDKGKAWAFTAKQRHIYFTDNYDYAWFDEILATQMGDCMASGVLQYLDNGWKIKHYQLSVAVPNGILDSVVKVIATHEKSHP